MKPLGIQNKLVFSYLALGAGIMLLSLWANRSIELSAERAHHPRMEVLRRTQELAALASSASEEGFSYVLIGEVGERARASSKLDKLGDRTRELSAIGGLTPAEVPLVASVGSAVDDFRAAGVGVFSTYAESGTVPRANYDAYETTLDHLVDEIGVLNATVQAQTENESIAVRRKSDLLTIGIGAIALVLALVGGGALGRHITGPLLSLRDAVVAFGRGEVTVTLPPASGDEVGQLASAFGRMAEDTRRYIETIRRAQRRLDDVFVSMEEILLVCDKDGIIVAANPAACRTSGLTEETLKGSRAAPMFARGPLDAAATHVVPTEGECVFASAGAKPVPVRLSVSSLRGPVGEGWVLVAQDLTERHRMESELRQAQKLEAIGRLASGVAHEINTPVQFVGDNLQFVRDACAGLFSLMDTYHRAAEAPPESRSQGLTEAVEQEARSDLPYIRENMPKAIESALEGLARIATIVRSMKEFAHPDQHEAVSVDLNTLVSSTLVIARHEYKYTANLVTEFGELPPVDCFPGEFNQAVLNLVVNAAHAIGDVVTGTASKGTITVRTRLDGDHAVVSITDSGPGIPVAIRDKIFDPFFTTKEVGRGTGQGLAIVRSIVVGKHGGVVRMESEVGHGTTFHLVIPVNRTAVRRAAA